MSTINDLRNANRALTEARNNVNLNIAEGRNRLAEINAQIDTNNAKIKGNVSRQEQQSLNVGGYTEAIQNAIIASPKAAGIIAAPNPRAVESLSKLIGYVEKTYSNSTDYFVTYLELIIGSSVKKGLLGQSDAAWMHNVINEAISPTMSKIECVYNIKAAANAARA